MDRGNHPSSASPDADVMDIASPEARNVKNATVFPLNNQHEHLILLPVNPIFQRLSIPKRASTPQHGTPTNQS